MLEALLLLEHRLGPWLGSGESSSESPASLSKCLWLWFWLWREWGVWSQLDCVWFPPTESKGGPVLWSLSVTCDTPLSLSDPGVWNKSPETSLFWDFSSRRSCFRFFFSILLSSLRAISSGSMGSPLQLVGWALWAGRPGPFFVFSFFLHLALRFWNHTCGEKKGEHVCNEHVCHCKGEVN